MNTYVINIEELKLVENGEADAGKAASATLRARLYYPEPGVHELDCVKVMQVKDGEDVGFKDTQNQEIDHRMLFYTYLGVDTYIEFEISRIEEYSAFEQFISKLAGGIAKGALGLAITNGLTLFSGPVKSAEESVIDGVFNQGSVTTKIAAGKMAIKMSELPIDGKECPLVFPQDVELKAHTEDRGGDRHVVTRKVYEKGKPNGSIKVSIKPVG